MLKAKNSPDKKIENIRGHLFLIILKPEKKSSLNFFRIEK